MALRHKNLLSFLGLRLASYTTNPFLSVSSSAPPRKKLTLIYMLFFPSPKSETLEIPHLSLYTSFGAEALKYWQGSEAWPLFILHRNKTQFVLLVGGECWGWGSRGPSRAGAMCRAGATSASMSFCGRNAEALGKSQSDWAGGNP